jgi:ubiquitin C-terminal hydrolase
MQSKSHEDPTQMEREENLPIGLKNLGATCYANALLQVWFNNPSFVAGVYAAASASMTQNTPGSANRDDLVPLTELARTFAHLQRSKLRYFNPERLVDSLGLRTEEQQDAQE